MVPGVVHLEDCASSDGFRSRDLIVVEEVRLRFLMLAALGVDVGVSSGVDGLVLTSTLSTWLGDMGSGVLQPESAWLFWRF